MNPPIIITGRGGSGTRLVSELAQHLGVYVGKSLNVSGDSLRWVPVIYPLVMATANHGLPEDPQHEPDIRNAASRFMATAPSRDGPWGWKLPEAMMVLPVCVNALSGTRVIHLVRHPIGFYHVRPHLTTKPDHDLGKIVLQAAYAYCGRDPVLIETDPEYMHGACSWQYQVERVVNYGRERLGGRYLEIQYERLCEDPDGHARIIAAFMDVPYKKWEPVIDHSRVRPRLARDTQEAREIWEVCGRTATALGYD